MRPDMFKVIVERPRRGGDRTKKNPLKNVSLEDLPHYESMKERHVRYWGGKELNENLNPLKRFLFGQVGRKWDDVFSEICEHINVNSTVQQHVRSHVFDFVEIDVGINELGYPFSKRWYRYSYRQHRPFNKEDLYVDPRNGILCRGKGVRKSYLREKKEKPDEKEINGQHYRRHEGIWYHITMTKTPELPREKVSISPGREFWRHAYPYVKDVFTHELVKMEAKFYASAKRQLNSKELKKLGLSNS